MNSSDSLSIVLGARDRDRLQAELDLALSAMVEFDRLHGERDDARRNALLRHLAAAVSAFLSYCQSELPNIRDPELWRELHERL